MITQLLLPVCLCCYGLCWLFYLYFGMPSTPGTDAAVEANSRN